MTTSPPTTALLPPELAQFEHWAFRAGLDGEDLWVAAPDVARILGYREAYHMTRGLDDDVKGPRLVGTLGGEQEITVLTEAGLYQAIMQRQSGRIEDEQVRDRIRRFQRWVTHEVLPSIRRTGSYSAVDPMSLEGIAAILQAGKAALDRAIAAEERAEHSEAIVDAIEATNGITITEFHKHYFSETRATDFFALLYRLGLLIDQRGARGRDDRGRIKNGHQHRHPAAAGKRFFYLHGRLDDNGVRREDTRVRPGEPEVELVRFLATKGLTPNSNALTGATTPKEIAA